MAPTTSGTALAERPTDWLSTLTTPRIPVANDALPAVRADGHLQRIVRPVAGVVSGLIGAVTDLAVTRDGRRLVAAHYGDDAVSVIDTATLTVTATVADIAEPYAVVAADRAYLQSASLAKDSVVAVDLEVGTELAAREVGIGASGLAAAPAGDMLYVARSFDGIVDIAAVDVESGKVVAIPVLRALDASIDTVRINAGGTRLYAALTTAAGGALICVDVRTGRVQTVSVGGTIDDIAVHADDRRVFVTGWDDELGAVLRVVDTSTARVVRTAAVDALPVSMVVAGSDVVLAHGDAITMIDIATMRTANRIDIRRPVSCLVVSPDGTTLYVGDFDGAVTALALQASSQARAAS
jgi:YVTN family beta-propeller protein